MKELCIEVKNIYGELKAYPACKTAELFAKIANTTTLTPKTLCYAEQLGYSIVELRKNSSFRRTESQQAGFSAL